MIKLTINPETTPTTLTFDQPVVVIGSDLLLDGEELQAEHIKLFWQHDSWMVCNLANDPFVTLNGLPFGKKKLNHNDLLQVGGTSIVIESEFAPEVKEEWYDTEEKLPQIVEDAIVAKAQSPISQSDLEAMMSEVEQLETTEIEQQAEIDICDELPEEVMPPEDPTPILEGKTPIKDYYLSEFDDENEGFIQEKEKKAEKANHYASLEPQRNWRLILFILITFLMITSTILGGVYISLNGRSGKEERLAAQGVADVAMALTYAQLHHINHPKHNWSDPDFLKNNLNAVLTSSYPSLAMIDSHGHFSNCPYILRVYTSRDLSQFLVIAQPAPSLFQWLIPKMTIVVDSRTMELRKLKDIKGLNRILVHASTLDGTNALDVTNTVKQGELIPLSSLTSKKGDLGFTTSSALSLLRPGAENRVYNAARYYLLGESILNKALALAESTATSHDVLLFRQLLEPFSKLTDFVMYSSNGMQSAMQAQKALAIFAPQYKFLIAYLVFNAKGTISGSHLLIDNDNSQVTTIYNPLILADEEKPNRDLSTYSFALAPLRAPNALPAKTIQKITEQVASQEKPENTHPLYLQLKAIAIERQQALKPVLEKMETLLVKEYNSPYDAFHRDFLKLLDRYESLDKAEQDKIVAALEILQKEYHKIPLANFVEHVEAANLGSLFQKHLIASNESQTKFQQAISELEINSRIEKVTEANDLEELIQKIHAAIEVITLKNLSNTDKLIAYQNTLRARVENALSRFLLSQDKKLPAGSFNEKNRQVLLEILKASWIVDSEEHDFFLNEFDLLGGSQ